MYFALVFADMVEACLMPNERWPVFWQKVLDFDKHQQGRSRE